MELITDEDTSFSTRKRPRACTGAYPLKKPVRGSSPVNGGKTLGEEYHSVKRDGTSAPSTAAGTMETVGICGLIPLKHRETGAR